MTPNRNTFFLPQEKFEELRQKYPHFNDPWLAEDVELLKELAAQGLSRAEMSAELGRTQNSVKMKLVELGLYVKKPQARPWTEDDNKAVVEMYKAGMELADIAVETGRSERAVIARLIKLHADIFDKKEAV